MDTYTFGILLYSISSVLSSRFCQWSKESAVAVSSCPKNESTMEVRAKIKNYEAMARIQNCTTSEKFKYYYVMNELETEFVEVCAPEYYIHGYCTEYNSLGAAMQEHFSLKCSDVKPPCNTSYLFSDAYLYRGCYKKIRERMQNSSTESISFHGIQIIPVKLYIPKDKSKKSKNPDLQIIILVVALAVITLSVYQFVIYKIQRAASSKRIKNEANLNYLVMSPLLTKDEKGKLIEKGMISKQRVTKRKLKIKRFTI